MNAKKCPKSLRVIQALVLAVTIPFCYVAAAANPEAANTETSAAASQKLRGANTDLVDPILTDAGLVSGALLDVQTVEGYTVGAIGKPVRMYRGIPYAAPPVGNLRWKPPQPAARWAGIREATALAPWCPQAFPAPVRYGEGGHP